MTMHARDASGRRVSLLNDDDTVAPSYQYNQAYNADPSYAAYYAQQASRSVSSSPNTPQLLRSDSYDSQMSSEPISPMTPLYDPVRYSATAVDPRTYDEYYMDTQLYPGTKRPHGLDSRSDSYEDDYGHAASNERPGKRFPCRYRDTHGCEKTFTTSGHASRHSKIHTAEKAVPCSYLGCTKKFTRADNMKQHLETHYKDKSRSSSRPSLSSGDRRSSTSGKMSSRSKSATTGTTPLPSPGGVWDMRELNLPLLSRSSALPTPTNGLDALAMAVACQEGA
ncbi:hypothetical protein QBC42DRAFT_47507 [Cladorrhinum samala]|uniref:C2H2 type master regulator of conidiophore development brlA n=1 Tax=Cladorrhinum samala TaxID=585594 RepID=A0AAV9H7C3_9PEZI|nr:hypothetical protein QBC42DRAFT_47507 [Cladorrhinum samala]